MGIGERIKQRRKELSISVDELAKRLNKNRTTVYRYEKGDIGNLPLDILEPLSEALETTPQYLMGWENENGVEIATKRGVILGDILKNLRVRNKITLEELSEEIGIPVNELLSYEAGNRQIPIDIVNALTEFFRVSLSDLIATRVTERGQDSFYISENARNVRHFERWHKEFGHVIFTDDEYDKIINFAKFLLSQREN